MSRSSHSHYIINESAASVARPSAGERATDTQCRLAPLSPAFRPWRDAGAPHYRAVVTGNFGITDTFRTIASGLAAAVVLATIDTPAAAQDAHLQTYPGANCVEEFVGTTIRAPSIAYDTVGRVHNNRTSRTVVICPISFPWLHAGSPGGTAALWPTKLRWWAHVYDGNSSTEPFQDVSCGLFWCAHTSTPGAADDCDIGTGDSTSVSGRKQLSNWSTPSEIGSYAKSVVLRCNMPARVGAERSWIADYTIHAFE